MASQFATYGLPCLKLALPEIIFRKTLTSPVKYGKIFFRQDLYFVAYCKTGA